LTYVLFYTNLLLNLLLLLLLLFRVSLFAYSETAVRYTALQCVCEAVHMG